MAQVGGRMGAGSFLRRLGLVSNARIAVACTVVVALLGLACAVRLSMPADAFTVVREVPPSSASSSGEKDVGSSPVAAEPAAAAPARVVVHVDGAVALAGVYELAGDDVRANDAVVAAGGLAPDADTAAINLAAPLTDGCKVHVPAMGEAAPAASPGATGSAEAFAPESVLVNINTATAEELTVLPGVGEATAAAIVRERETGGPFSSIEDVMRVSGIGEKRFERMRDAICV